MIRTHASFDLASDDLDDPDDPDDLDEESPPGRGIPIGWSGA